MKNIAFALHYPSCTEGRNMPCSAIADVLVVATNAAVDSKRVPPVPPC
jgi:hypothetical protein